MEQPFFLVATASADEWSCGIIITEILHLSHIRALKQNHSKVAHNILSYGTKCAILHICKASSHADRVFGVRSG
jgi:hypothetical protein